MSAEVFKPLSFSYSTIPFDCCPAGLPLHFLPTLTSYSSCQWLTTLPPAPWIAFSKHPGARGRVGIRDGIQCGQVLSVKNHILFQFILPPTLVQIQETQSQVRRFPNTCQQYSRTARRITSPVPTESSHCYTDQHLTPSRPSWFQVEQLQLHFHSTISSTTQSTSTLPATPLQPTHPS